MRPVDRAWWVRCVAFACSASMAVKVVAALVLGGPALGFGDDLAHLERVVALAWTGASPYGEKFAYSPLFFLVCPTTALWPAKMLVFATAGIVQEVRHGGSKLAVLFYVVWGIGLNFEVICLYLYRRVTRKSSRFDAVAWLIITVKPQYLVVALVEWWKGEDLPLLAWGFNAILLAAAVGTAPVPVVAVVLALPRVLNRPTAWFALERLVRDHRPNKQTREEDG